MENTNLKKLPFPLSIFGKIQLYFLQKNSYSHEKPKTSKEKEKVFQALYGLNGLKD